MKAKNLLQKLQRVYLIVLIVMIVSIIGMVTGCGKGNTGPAGADGNDFAVLTYIGSAACSGGSCHAAIYDTFVKSGHNYKLNKVVSNTMPVYPFSNITAALGLVNDEDGVTDNTLGTPTSYADISYVIGGYGWKARFIDKDGYIVTGSEVQYNLATNTVSAYHDNEIDKKYNCGNCHTTGWKRTTDATTFDFRNRATQDDLPGMDGTFALQGIQCESCHGAGSTHAQTKSRSDITKVATARTTSDFLASDMAYGKPVACSECHTRDGEKDYPTYVSAFTTASGLDIEGGRINATDNLIKHHEQYDELLGIDPSDITNGSTRTSSFTAAKSDCTGCHNPHATTEYQDISGHTPGVAATCESCHAGTTISVSSMANFDCKECHMPKMVKSAVKTFTGTDSPDLGDIKTHILKIDLTNSTQYTTDGKYAYPWITVDYACRRCHSQDGLNAGLVSSITNVPAGYLDGSSIIH